LKIGQLDGAFLLRIQFAHQRAHALGTPLLVKVLFVLRSDDHGIQFVRLILEAALPLTLEP